MQRRTMLRSLLASPFVAPSASHRSDGASDGETGKSTSASVVAAPTVFDVMVYGARGDGEADDRSAIAAADRAARAVRGTVYFPDAVGYRIGASITVGSPLHF